MQHPDEGTIHAWLDDALDPAEHASVAAHVAVCEHCAAIAAEARGMIAGASRITAMLDGVRGGVLPTSPAVPVTRTASLWTTLRITPARAALAAGLLIAAAGVLTVRHDTSTQGVPHNVLSGADMSPRASMSPDRSSSATTEPIAPSLAPTPPAALRTAEPAAHGAIVAEQTQAPAAGGPPPVRPIEQRGGAASLASASSVAASNVDSTPPSRATAAMPASAGAAPVVASATTPKALLADAGDARQAALERMSHKDSAMTSTMLTQAELRARAAFAAPNGGEARTMMRLEQVMKRPATGASAFAGCYRINADSVAWPRSLPMLFSLTTANAQSGVTRNVVRAVGADGRVDSVVAGGTWRQLTPSVVDVTFAGMESHPSLTLQLVGDARLRADAHVEARVTVVPITRTDCKP